MVWPGMLGARMLADVADATGLTIVFGEVGRGGLGSHRVLTVVRGGVLSRSQGHPLRFPDDGMPRHHRTPVRKVSARRWV